jgi:hypothetical protein
MQPVRHLQSCFVEIHRLWEVRLADRSMMHSSLERTPILHIFNHQQDGANPPPLSSPAAFLERGDREDAARCCHSVVEHSSAVEQREWLLQLLDSDLQMETFVCVNEEVW